uniref:Uncharacterized protein n=1 Tax=Chlamydomonas euryale TaxID=1486919 RepID=A0A7R9Z377_9CHLO|mmetsp:Transcript_41519/g.124079  ORF Transcript_41519/g.124079 Transcript_41519/m.124079 type:complete len:151 (+) Transcript_41519:57-509(+)
MSSSRTFARAARAMFSAAARSAETSCAGLSSSVGRAFVEARSSPAMRSQGNPVLQAWRQEQAKMSGCKAQGFAASGLHSAAMPTPVANTGSQVPGVQACSLTTAAGTLEDCDDDTSMCSSSRSHISELSSSEEDDDETLLWQKWKHARRK